MDPNQNPLPRGSGQPNDDASQNGNAAQPTPQRESGGQLNVPPRQPESTGAPVNDISESAFGFEDVQASPRVANAVPPAQLPQTLPPTPPPPPQVPTPAIPPPQTPVMQDVLPPTAPPEVPTLQQPPSPPTDISSEEPAVPLPPAQPPVDTPQAPPSPTPIPPTPLSYQPASAQKHLPENLASRITETPIQNSSDILGRTDKKGRFGRVRSFVSFLVFIAGIFVAAFLINQFVFQSYYVEGTSMTPTLQNDDRLIIDKVERTIANVQGAAYVPERGQIIVLDSSIIGSNGNREQLIKRVIGLPGETVTIEDGVVTIVNQDNPEGFDVDDELGLTLENTHITGDRMEVSVPEGHVFVMGDNRGKNGSYDSRSFGPVASDKIEGRLWARILPLHKAQLF